jgi:hypothetical protein
MEWTIQDLGAAGEFIGAVLVVVTLIYLGRQITQNTKMVEGTALQTWWTASSAGRFEIVTDSDLAKLMPAAMTDAKSLDESNWVSVGLYIENLFRQQQMTYLLHKKGVLDTAVFDVEMRVAAKFLQFPGFRQWWEAGKNVLLPEFVTYLEKLDPGKDTNFYWTPEEGFVSADKALDIQS